MIVLHGFGFWIWFTKRCLPREIWIYLFPKRCVVVFLISGLVYGRDFFELIIYPLICGSLYKLLLTLSSCFRCNFVSSWTWTSGVFLRLRTDWLVFNTTGACGFLTTSFYSSFIGDLKNFVWDCEGLITDFDVAYTLEVQLRSESVSD